VGSVTKEISRLFLPFAVPTGDRETFTHEMEMATVFCLVESEREKGGGVIQKKPPEEFSFVTEIYFPLWLAPWIKRKLLFDGLAISTHTLSYDVLPDIQVFNSEICESANTHEAYSANLLDHLNFFENFVGKEEKTIEGLITDSGFIEDFVKYLPEAVENKEPEIEKVILEPTLDEETISSLLRELSSIREALKKDSLDLSQAMKLLNTTTKEQVKAISKAIKKIEKDFDKKIAVATDSALKEIRKIHRIYDKKITEVARKFERELQVLHREQVRGEQTVSRLTAMVERFEVERETCRSCKNGRGEAHWKQEIEEAEKQLSIFEKALGDLDKKIEEVNSARNFEIAKLRTEYTSQAERVKAKTSDLKASCKAAVQLRQEEMSKLEEMSHSVVDQMDRLLKLKRVALSEIEGEGITGGGEKFMLVYVPFYLACCQNCQNELKKRYVFYSPSYACGMGGLTKLKGVFGAAKVKSLFQNRSKSLTNLLDQLKELIEHNPVFEKDIIDAGFRANILRTRELREKVREGLEQLRDEKWLSENEFQMFSEALKQPVT
jgi:hypothetical protein